MKKVVIPIIIVIVLIVSAIVVGFSIKSAPKGQKSWAGETIEHKGFKDLGNYIIELPDYTDPAALERGIAAFNNRADHGEMPATFGCTVMAKKNSKGEVVMGRNMDLDISQNPAYVYKTTFGKYKNFCIAYSPNFYKTYAETQKLEEIDPTIQDLLLTMCCDSLNEKGLYIEMNLRERNDKLTCYGLHSSHGETVRDDGTPWSELRACSTNAVQLVSQNCATVQEAIDYLKNSYDWYTVSPPLKTDLALSNNNICFMIGDATGEYGLIEIAQDEISYIPYQYGQSNYYITPKWNAIDSYAVGHGRLGMVSKMIGPVETLEDAMKAMEPIMWRNETLWIGESHRVTDGTRLHPNNQICFEDNNGNPQMDWRSEYVFMWPVMDDGRMLMSANMYEEAKQSDYDPMIKKYFDDAIGTGRMVIDDGSYKFDVNGETLNLTELFEKYNEYKSSEDAEKKKELKPYYDKYYHLLENQNRGWVHDDTNFEALKAAAYARLHIRYDADGNFDPSSMSKYEKLLSYYGVGGKADETPLRDDGGVWTTSLNLGVNCAQKKIKLRFWENDDVIYEFGF
ncbi:MAG: linear amide C-N hydrolase [Lachnospiraceae bacterium]|nr:linear amide C-N hydrolase [Lachnospiraceae bacterium]